MLPANRAEPRVALVQDLLLREGRQAVVQVEPLLHPGHRQRLVALSLRGSVKISLKIIVMMFKLKAMMTKVSERM